MTTAVPSVAALSCDEATTKMATWLKKNLDNGDRHTLTHGTSEELEGMAESLCRDYTDTRPNDLSQIIRTGIKSKNEGTLKSAFREALRKLKSDLDTQADKKGRVAA